MTIFALCLVASILAGYSSISAAAMAVDEAAAEFGGYFLFQDSGACLLPNPFTGSCTCLNNTFPDLGYVYPDNPSAATVLCYGTRPGAFQGAFMTTNTSSAECVTPNKFTGMCSCPSTTTTEVPYTPFHGRGELHHVVTFCYGAEPSLYFGGISADLLFPNSSSHGDCPNPFVTKNASGGDGCSTCPSSNYSTNHIFSGIAASFVCGPTCWLPQSIEACSAVEFLDCTWCRSNASATGGTCYPPERGVWCCADDGSVHPCPTPVPDVPCPCCGTCYGEGAFCCQNWDAMGSSFCCDNSMCPPNQTPSCGPADYMGPCMCYPN